MAFQFLRHLKVLFIAGVSTWLALGEATDAAPPFGAKRQQIEAATQHGAALRIVPIATEGWTRDLPAATQAEESAPDLRLATLHPPAVEEPARLDGLLGGVAIPVRNLAILPQWERIVASDPTALFGHPCAHEQSVCESLLLKAWQRLHADSEARARTKIELVRQVNIQVNHAIAYRSDMTNYGVSDYWASPEETAQRGAGDCEDIAIAKLWMLIKLGIPDANMQVVIVKDLRRGVGHAVLNVKIGESNLILDNMTDMVLPDTVIDRYQPLYAVSATGSWIYGVRRPIQVVSAAAGRRAMAASLDPALELRGTIPTHLLAGSAGGVTR
jgi:predicted transglutaminase-like cysteine proteinase